MTPCVRSHTVPGEHAPGCTCTRECPDHEGHCPGCLPAEAGRGLLCPRCAERLEGFLGGQEGLGDEGQEVHGLPWAYDHLEHARPSLSQAPGSGGSSIEDAEAERLSALVSVRADMYDRLLYWTFAVMNASGLSGPDVPAPERLSVRRCAAFLLTHVSVLCSHAEADRAWQELADLMSLAHALAPWRPVPTHIDGIPCRCGEMALHDHGDEIKCWRCSKSYTREQYKILVKVMARRFAPEPVSVGGP